MQYGITFFGSYDSHDKDKERELIFRSSEFADRSGLEGIWIPERHFGAFGGYFPNPALICAALSRLTTKIKLRAGSLILPLHDTLRAVEEWAMVDLLSGGRVEISFGSGWNANDFVLFPERYAERRNYLKTQLREFLHLWEGGDIQRKNGVDRDIIICPYPQPAQRQLPIWITSSSSEETFRYAASVGAGILTHAFFQSFSELERRISIYHDAFCSRHGSVPRVAILLHQCIVPNGETVPVSVREALRGYLSSSIQLEIAAARGGGAISGNLKPLLGDPDAQVISDLVDLSFEKYYENLSLVGSVDHCVSLVKSLGSVGVSDIVGLIDFIPDPDIVLKYLPYLLELKSKVTM